MTARLPIRGGRFPLGAGLALPGALVAGVVLALAAAPSPPAPSAAPSITALGPVPASQGVSFELVLGQPGRRRAQLALTAIENSASPSFRHTISPANYGARFGLSARVLAPIEAWLRPAGMRITSSYPQRTALEVNGPAAVVQHLFGVRLVRYRDASGRGFTRALGAPRIPAPLRPAVQAVIGLDTQPDAVAHDVPLSGLNPIEAAIAYDVAALHRAGYDGQGQTIAILSLTAYDPSDPIAFAHEYHLAGPQPQVVSVHGGTTDTSNVLEADLDIDVIRAIAPAARVLVYEASNTPAGTSEVLNAILAQHRSSIVSSSWGTCEPQLGAGEHAAEADALRSLVSAGVSVFVASGDQGAYDCQQSNAADDRLAVDYPAASADAISVGGTRLLLGPGYRYAGEAAWLDTLYAEGGGGGISRFDARPAWQAGPGVLSRFSNGHRQVPDVSAAADPGTAWALYAEGGDGTESGTSAAAPFWAATTALVAQYATRHHAGRLGFYAPILYALARRAWRRPPFHDVVRGYNRFYSAGPGWDPATGLGSPDVANLAHDTVSYLRSLSRHARPARRKRR